MTNSVFDKQKIIDLKEIIEFNDQAILTEGVVSQFDEWVTWDDIGEVFNEPGYYETFYLNKANNITDHVSAMGFKLRDDDPHMRRDFRGNLINFTPCTDGHGFLKKKHTVIISDWERNKECVQDLINYLLDVFYIELDNHGVWPAQINYYSGHGHLYCGLSGSNSYHPHCEGSNTFLFQLIGKQRVTIYHNRSSMLTELELDPLQTPEERQAILDRLEVKDVWEINPSDMVYIPNRQYYYIEPLEDTVSLQIPLTLNGPLGVIY